jgi:HlyD family secretion protein
VTDKDPIIGTEDRSETGGSLAPGNLPATIVPPMLPGVIAPVRRRGRWVKLALILLVLALGAGGGYEWWRQSQGGLPPGIAFGNGRIEADEIDIDTKFSGRIATLMVDEGDMVTADQVLARMDTSDLEASLKRDQAQMVQAQKAVDEDVANVAQQMTQIKFARQELGRTSDLLGKGYATRELFDQRKQALDGANATLAALNARIAEARQAVDAAKHAVELDQVNIADNTLVAPRDGRIQYRIADVGEVLPVGGKVFVMLDTAYVYLDIYLPTADAGRVTIGADARIVLDALPNRAIPAKVTFLATEAQFTPKQVETQSERDKLMFRVRVHIDPALLRAHAESVRTGLPGVTYVRLDPKVPWPPQLQGRAAG